MKTKEELQAEIYIEINSIRHRIKSFSSTDRELGASIIAISNLYIALSNLIK